MDTLMKMSIICVFVSFVLVFLKKISTLFFQLIVCECFILDNYILVLVVY